VPALVHADPGNSVASFERALGAAASGGAFAAVPDRGLSGILRPFTQINAESVNLSARMAAATEPGGSITPGEMAVLTVRCHEFMFHCQLTASVAHRTADGLGQLLRQPS
jgi:hypothetical protein